jgi:hypothetical protein
VARLRLKRLACGSPIGVFIQLLALVFAPAATSAQDPPPLPGQVNLQITPCETASYDVSELVELLRVELHGLGVMNLRVESTEPEYSSSGSLALIRLGCGSAPATLAIDLADLIGGNRVTRELLVDDLKPSGRARALSIAIASLLESSWSLIAARPVQAQTGSGPAALPDSVRIALRRRLSDSLRPQPSAAAVPEELPPALQPKAPPAPAPPFGLSAAIAARAFPSRGTGLTGIDLAIEPSRGQKLSVAFDLDAMYGRQLVRDSSAPIAELHTLWLSLGATLYFATPTTPEFQLGPMLRVAYARVLASADSEQFTTSDKDGWLMMFGVSSVLSFDLSPAWALYMGADITYVPGGLNFSAEGTRAVSFADMTLAFRLGFSWSS